MRVKAQKLGKDHPTGIPPATVAVSPAVLDNGMPEVMQVISALDPYSIQRVIASLRLSPDEARQVARSLVLMAEKAEMMADKKHNGG